MKSALLAALFRFYQLRFRPLRGWTIISNNCVGGTLSQLAGDRYNSPTVGLWLTNDGYKDFCGRFPTIVREPLVFDPDLTERLGYPVGDLSGVKIMFMHYATFDDAAKAWRRRVERIDLNKLLFVCAARDDLQRVAPETAGHFDAAHLEQFRQVPYPKLLLTNSIGKDEQFAVVPTKDRVEDLHSWLPLAHALSARRLRQITTPF